MSRSRFKMVVPRKLWDPVKQRFIKAVDAGEYLALVDLALRYKKASKVPILTPLEGDHTVALARVAANLRNRLYEAEKQLWLHSEGKASYFDDFPDAHPPTSLREL